MLCNKMNNSGWILCPSKRFPGKFYYYNVLNGESAWSFNETEKKFLRIDDKTKLITQKWHSYPEPVSPPGKGLNYVTKSNILFPQKFGQATFQNYFNPVGLKHWNHTNNKSNISKKRTSGIQYVKNTEVPKKNIDIQTDLPEPDIIVQSCKEPLSKRFRKYQNYGNDNTAPSPKINSFPRTNDNMYNVNENYSESNKKNTNNTNELAEHTSKDRQEKLFLSYPTTFNTNLMNELGENDLRYIIRAKRSEKKTGEPQTNTVKKVRFNLSLGINKDNNVSELQNEDLIRDQFNTTTTKIIKHIQNIASDKFIGNQHHHQHEDDVLKHIKFVVKNSNSKNLFLQGTNAEEINPFQFKNEKKTIMGNVLKNQDVKGSLNISKPKPMISVPDNDNYEICNDDLSDVSKIMQEKLYVRASTENKIDSNSKILFLKSSPHENPFKKYKSKINPYLKHRSWPRTNATCPNLFAPNELIDNNFKEPNINLHTLKESVSSTRNVNFFDPKLYGNNSGTKNYCNNSLSPSEYTDDQIYFEYTNTNSKINGECLTYDEKNKIGTRNSWLNERLRKFYTRNAYIDKMITIRTDEIICCFTQIMEDIIYKILETSTCPPPYSLYDAILLLRRKFSDHTHILQVIDKITNLDIFCSKTGYLKDNVHPYELIKALGCGLVFIEALNESQMFEVKDSESALLRLVSDIEDPQTVELPQPTNSFSRDDSTEQPDRANFVKRRSDIIKYLQNHFPEWKHYHEEHQQIPSFQTNNGHNVLVTTGKDLHLFKINNKNQMYREPEEQKEPDIQSGKEYDGEKIIRKFHVIDKFENKIKEVNTKDIAPSIFQEKHVPKSPRKDKEGNEEIYEENIDLCGDQPAETDNIYMDKVSNESVVFIEPENEISETKPAGSPHVDMSTRINESSTITDDFPVLNHDDVTGYYTDANEYYFFVKKFLTELSTTLLLIHSFIKDNVDRFHDTKTTGDDKKELHDEANQTYVNLKHIILDLKNIIEREARHGNAIRILLIGAEGSSEDKKITNYRQVIAKCLEQARRLAGCLRLLMRATDHDCTLSVSSDAGDPTCINIFE